MSWVKPIRFNVRCQSQCCLFSSFSYYNYNNNSNEFELTWRCVCVCVSTCVCAGCFHFSLSHSVFVHPAGTVLRTVVCVHLRTCDVSFFFPFGVLVCICENGSRAHSARHSDGVVDLFGCCCLYHRFRSVYWLQASLVIVSAPRVPTRIYSANVISNMWLYCV